MPAIGNGPHTRRRRPPVAPGICAAHWWYPECQCSRDPSPLPVLARLDVGRRSGWNEPRIHFAIGEDVDAGVGLPLDDLATAPLTRLA
jgi:hypothetical protein